MSLKPHWGKTYTLYGSLDSTDQYFERVRSIADLCLTLRPDTASLLSTVQNAGRHLRRLRKNVNLSPGNSLEPSLVSLLEADLAEYTLRVAAHLKELPLLKSWDRTLAMKENDYHLAMLEIELTNRINVIPFRRCSVQLAFLPHCLRDVTVDCHSAKRGEDYVCKGCSGLCHINEASKLLRRHGAVPYIWMTANLRSVIKKFQKEGKTVGMIGAACIPELQHGMRMCMRAGVPVVGVPLDANRCARWCGEFYPTTLNMNELKMLLGDRTLEVSKNFRSSVGVRVKAAVADSAVKSRA